MFNFGKARFDRRRYRLLITVMPFFSLSCAILSGERSVMPGINKVWKSSNIKPLVAKLEKEGRDIYVHREAVATIVNPRPGSVLADIGAGSGFMAELFSPMVGPRGKVYAVDINRKLMKRLARRADEKGLRNIETVVCGERSVDLPHDSVDLVFLCDTYHHFEYPKATMQSIHDALRPGGELVLVEYKRIPGVTDDWYMEHMRAGQEVFTQEIVEYGFELIKVHDASFMEKSYILRFRKVEKSGPGQAAHKVKGRPRQGVSMTGPPGAGVFNRNG